MSTDALVIVFLIFAPVILALMALIGLANQLKKQNEADDRRCSSKKNRSK